jgi:hypothetical protein
VRVPDRVAVSLGRRIQTQDIKDGHACPAKVSRLERRQWHIHLHKSQTERKEMITNADDMQVGGQHYKNMGMQPWAVMEAVLTPEEFIGFLKGNVIKYGMRQGKKESDDANKARHYAAKLKEIQDGRNA